MPVVNADPHLFASSVSHKNSLKAHAAQREGLQAGFSTHLPKCAQTSQDTAADPGRVLPLGRRKNLYAHVLDGQPLHLSQQAVAKALGERAAAGKHNVGVQRLAQVQVCPVDRVDHDLVNAWVLETDDLRVEQDLGCPEPLSADLKFGFRKVSFNFFPRGAAGGRHVGRSAGKGHSLRGRTFILFPSGSVYSTTLFWSSFICAQSFSSFLGSCATYVTASLMCLTTSFSALVWNT